MKQMYFVASVILSGCFASFPLGDLDGQVTMDSDTFEDGGSLDSGMTDSGPLDSGMADSGMADSGMADSGMADSGMADSGMADSGLLDSSSPSYCSPLTCWYGVGPVIVGDPSYCSYVPLLPSYCTPSTNPSSIIYKGMTVDVYYNLETCQLLETRVTCTLEGPSDCEFTLTCPGFSISVLREKQDGGPPSTFQRPWRKVSSGPRLSFLLWAATGEDTTFDIHGVCTPAVGDPVCLGDPSSLVR